METRGEIITAVSAEGRSETRKPPRKKTKWTKESIVGLIILLIPLVGYLIFSGFPVVISFIIQFADMDRFDLDSLKWNNFANFSAVFTDGRFWHSIGITLWLLATQFVSLFIALVMAALLSRDVKGSKIFQIIYFVPYICLRSPFRSCGCGFSTEVCKQTEHARGSSQQYSRYEYATGWIIPTIPQRLPGRSSFRSSGARRDTVSLCILQRSKR